MSTFISVFLQPLFLLHTMKYKLVKGPFVLLSVIAHFEFPRSEIKTKCTNRSSPSSSLGTFSFDAKLDISIMYSIILLLSLYFMEMSLAKRLLISAFSFLIKYCSISSRNFFAFSPSEIEPRNASQIKPL